MFVASDVTNEETSEDGSSHRIERRCTLDVDAPRLLKRVRLIRPFSASAHSEQQHEPCAGFADRRGGLRLLHPEELAGPEGADAAHRVTQ